ncbi:hypothetical protein EZ449_12640 [Pedobacter frigidisoli]|uniref:Uncharacterized protein n=1 Tax=Pedobacter frigidisoli TaxID=2530455 RepID=A0A4R0P3N8_9SPHI|nr:hypothetical protein [Pedobacter frigidisoli]TCD08250.1 hypothetical protein EZ449_12640 [Pedobacter frigidisoli]
MNSYKYLMNKIYPARVNDQPDMQFYKEMIKAHFKLQSAVIGDESLILDYRNAFFFLRNHIHNAVKDGYRLITNQLDEADKNQLEENIHKLETPLYDISELEKILSYINLIFSAYDLTQINEKSYQTVTETV